MDTLYKCDPEKNTACTRRICYVNGGACNATKHLEFALQPVTTVTLVMDATEDDLKMFGVGKNGKPKAGPRARKKSKGKNK